MIAKNLPSPAETPQSRWYAIDSPKLTLEALPNVFSGERLDGGSRLLLSALPALAPAQEVVDLACGNGVLGLAALATGITQSLTFCDESAMAIESARRNSAALTTKPPAGKLDMHFHHGDGLLDLTTRPDLILCNPPFHLHHVVDEFAGQRLLHQCAQALVPSGQLLLVANRHLKYAPLMRRHFARVERVAQDERFVVWQAFAG
jgi:16S rRNA G1207 methylase RsmC